MYIYIFFIYSFFYFWNLKFYGEFPPKTGLDKTLTIAYDWAIAVLPKHMYLYIR